MLIFAPVKQLRQVLDSLVKQYKGKEEALKQLQKDFGGSK